MSDTQHLGLPLLAASQAQKHVTHNEALMLVDALLQLGIISRALAAPPGSPEEGDRYLVAASASGGWSGHDGELACFIDGVWRFMAPQAGWLLWCEDEEELLVFDGTDWRAGAGIDQLNRLGINTAADAVNRFALRSNAALFTAIYAADGGNGDIQHKINKESAGDTASQLYQTDFSGRAETGLCGDDDFHVKVSPDGSAWREALLIEGDSGHATFSMNDGPLPLPSTSTVFRIAAKDETPSRMLLDDWGAHFALTFRRAQGTASAPAAMAEGQSFGLVACEGYGATGYVSGYRAKMDFFASETWSDTIQGCEIAFFTTANGQSAPGERLRIKNDGKLGLGTSAPNAKLAISENTAAGPAALSGSMEQLIAADSTAARVELVTFHSSGQVAFRRSEGSAGSPEATASGQLIGGLSAFGYDGTNWTTSANATVQILAAEAWGPTARGTKFRVQTTPLGATSAITALTIAADGSLQMGGGETTVIDGNRHFRPRSYAAGSLPSQDSGDVIASSDIPGAWLAADGTDWLSPGVKRLRAVTADTTISIPAGWAIERIHFAETAGSAVTGGIRIGTTSGASDVVAAQTVGANALDAVDEASILKRIFSRSTAQTLFIQAATSWNGASVELSFTLKKVF
ncbi:MAG: DUF2793 domain-containing protein [Parvibaculaceae bacterium]